MAMHGKSHRGPGGHSDPGTGQRPAVSSRRPAAPGSRGSVTEGNEPQGDGLVGGGRHPYPAQYQGSGSVTENPKGRE